MLSRARAAAPTATTGVFVVALAVLVLLTGPVRAADTADAADGEKPSLGASEDGASETDASEDGDSGNATNAAAEEKPTPEDTLPPHDDTSLSPSESLPPEDDTEPAGPEAWETPPDDEPVPDDANRDAPGDGEPSPPDDNLIVDDPASPPLGPPPFPFDEPPFPGDIPGWMPFELNEHTLGKLLLEIALLHELDGFADPQPPAFASIHEAYGPWPEESSRGQTLDLLFAVDDELAEIKNDVIAVNGPSPSLAQALDEIPASQRALLRSGNQGVVPVHPYTTAFHDLATFGSAAQLREEGSLEQEIAFVLGDILAGLTDPSAINDLRPAANQVQLPTADLASRLDAIDGEPADGAPWLTILAIALAGLFAGILITLFVLRRRRDGGDVDRDRVTELIWEAHRRLSSARTEEDVVRIASTTAVAITDATDVYVFRVAEGGLRPAGTERVVTRSALLRVAETAQPLIDDIRDDAAVGTAAVCAVPLVNEGTMAGILATRREPGRLFSRDDRHRLELLAPAVGGALLSADQLDSLGTLAMVDGLTALGNRRRLDGDLETTLAEAVANDLPVAFAMIDVDHFKLFNDTHGHEAGDAALQTVARIIERTVRASDVVYRYGGEEFSVLLPAATVDEARVAGERIRAAVEGTVIAGGETQPGGRLTVSVGISTLEAGPAEELKTRADEALYQAKALGRNRSIVA